MARGIVGIDEVGRGCLAGPLYVAAAFVPRAWKHFKIEGGGMLRDSKKLTKLQREVWFAYLRFHPKILYAVSRVSAAGVDKFNVARAANRAAASCLRKLGKLSGLSDERMPIVLDGGLYVGNGKQPVHAQTLPKADETVPAVAIASIIAKVTRDRAMVALSKKYPEYAFEIHKGYGTALHRERILKHGLCALHRLTFTKKYHTMSPNSQ